MAIYKEDIARDAVQLNGKFIEDLIPGHYYTLTASGRETLTREVNFSEYRRNGVINDYNRYPERVITVYFIIDGDSPSAFRENMNYLMSLLDVEDADIKFNDEMDKFLIGTISVNELEEKHGTWASGSYSIVCEDPFKYSTTVKESTPVVSGNEATFTINYEGNQPSRPLLRATFGAGVSSGAYTDDDDCGFVAFFDDEEHIIQLGNPDAENLDASAKAKILYSANVDNIQLSNFTSSWTNSSVGSVSRLLWRDLNYNKGAGYEHYFLQPNGYGSDNTQSEHGPSYQLTDANGFQNFTFNYVARLYSTNPSQERGALQLWVRDSSNHKYGVTIYKTDTSSTGVVGYWVDDKIVSSTRIDLSEFNEHFGKTAKTAVYKTITTKEYYNEKAKKWQSSPTNGLVKITVQSVVSGYVYGSVNGNIAIQKIGNTFYYKVGNLPIFKYTYSKADGSTMVFNKAEIGFKKLKAYTPMFMGLSFIKCRSTEGSHFLDTPNVFSAGDIVEADCNSANVVLYGVNSTEGRAAPEYGALGNDWEDFMLTPGTNLIKATWSDWVTTPPTLKILYNEVYI